MFVLFHIYEDGRKVYVNANHITCILEGSGDYTLIGFSSNESYFKVKETLKEVQMSLRNIGIGR